MEVKILVVGVVVTALRVIIRYFPEKKLWLPVVVAVPVIVLTGLLYMLGDRLNNSSIIVPAIALAAIGIYCFRVIRAKREEVFKEIREWVSTVSTALIMAFFIMSFLIQSFAIPSGSMRNTFLEGDHLFVGKFQYGVRSPFSNKIIIRAGKPSRGDLVVFMPPLENAKDPYIKRCIGVQGDVIRMEKKKLYINGVLQSEPYVVYRDSVIYPDDEGVPVQFRIRDNFGPVKVSSGCYFMMGDNRDCSYDSRFWGEVKDSNIKGRALVIYWPVNRVGIPR